LNAIWKRIAPLTKFKTGFLAASVRAAVRIAAKARHSTVSMAGLARQPSGMTFTFRIACLRSASATIAMCHEYLS
jgi:hypothetical protein